MRTFLALGIALLGLSGCFDSTVSVASGPSTEGFRPWVVTSFESKVVLRSAVGRFGPLSLGPLGVLSRRDTANALWGSWTRWGGGGYGTDFVGQLSSPFQSSFRPYVHPWLDSTAWIDALPGGPQVAISLNEGIDHTILSLDLCPDLPAEVFRRAADSSMNPLIGGSILKSGSYAFLFVHQGWTRAPQSGVAVLRLRRTSTAPVCGAFADPNTAFAATWSALGPEKPWLADQTSIRILDAIPMPGGVMVSFASQKLNDNSEYRLAFVDTTGTLSPLDSSTTGFYSRLFGHGGRTWGLHYTRGVVELTRNGSWERKKDTWSSEAWLECFDVAGRCILRSRDKLFLLDTNTLDVRELDRTGLETNLITGIVAYKDTAYVSTLSGVFTKPVAQFFEPAN